MPKAKKKQATTNGAVIRTVVNRPLTPKNGPGLKQARAATDVAISAAAPRIIPLQIHVHPRSDNDDWKDEDYTEFILELFLKDAFEKEDAQNKKAKK